MSDTNILIVEDELIIAQNLKEGLEKNGYGVLGITNSRNATLSFIKEKRPHVALIDIVLSEFGDNEDGIDLGKELKAKYSIPVIFMSSHTDKLLSEKLTSERIIKKPISDIDELSIFIQQEIRKKNNHLHSIFKESFFIKAGKNNETIRITYSELLYVKGEGNVITFNIEDGRKYSLATTLRTFLLQIDHPSILRVHNSYVINIEKITGYEGNSLLIGDAHIPFRKTFIEDFSANIKYIFTKLSYQ